jgi:hypothetical protein
MRVLQACWLLAQRTGGVTGCRTSAGRFPSAGEWCRGLACRFSRYPDRVNANDGLRPCCPPQVPFLALELFTPGAGQ